MSADNIPSAMNQAHCSYLHPNQNLSNMFLKCRVVSDPKTSTSVPDDTVLSLLFLMYSGHRKMFPSFLSWTLTGLISTF